jgi:hypothetical protein
MINKATNYQTVTCLFTIGRQKIDGRSSKEYLKNLNELLKSYPHTIIFHDGTAKKLIISNPEAVFIEIKLTDLPLYKYRKEIENISNIRSIKNHNKDLVFKLPDYGLVINSKTFFLNEASMISDKEYLIWMDAGISRFFPGLESRKIIPKQIRLSNAYDYVFQIDLKNWIKNYRFLTLPINWIRIGSSQRVISGAMFVCRSRSAGHLNKEFVQKVIDSLHDSKWDTEQVFLFKIMHDLRVYYLIQNRDRIINFLPEKPNKINLFVSKVIHFFFASTNFS